MNPKSKQATVKGQGRAPFGGGLGLTELKQAASNATSFNHIVYQIHRMHIIELEHQAMVVCARSDTPDTNQIHEAHNLLKFDARNQIHRTRRIPLKNPAPAAGAWRSCA